MLFRSWRLPAVQKIVTGRRTAVAEAADTQMLDQPVLPASLQPLSGSALQGRKIELAKILADIGIASQGSDPEATLGPAHRSVGKEGQQRRLSVEFEYKEAYLKNFIEKKYNIPYKELKNALQYTNTYDRIPEAEIIANQVLSYKGNAPEGYMFFDAKVEEV